jgi:hypothetical protein
MKECFSMGVLLFDGIAPEVGLRLVVLPLLVVR